MSHLGRLDFKIVCFDDAVAAEYVLIRMVRLFAISS